MMRWAEGVRGLAIVLTVAVIGVARAETELEGTWLATAATVSGKPAPQVVGHRLSFERHRFQIIKDGELLYGGSFSVDATAKLPTIRFDQNETKTLAGIWLGIYERDGDKLTICDNAHDMTKPRPTGFGECSGAGYILIHFTR